MQFLCEMDEALKSKVLAMLPPYDGLILRVKFVAQNDFTCILRLSITDKDGAFEWLKEFEEITKTSHRVSACFQENSPRLVFKKGFHCQHCTRPRPGTTPHYKHTGCPARLIITVKQADMKRSKDAYLKKYPCEINLHFVHNHSVDDPETPRSRLLSAEVEEIFTNYYVLNNHSPSSALEMYKAELHAKHGANYFKIVCDSAICPDWKWCNDLYKSLCKKDYVQQSRDDMFNALRTDIEIFNIDKSEPCAAVYGSPDSYVLVICTPFMKRVYNLESCCEVLFVDSMLGVDARIFFIMTASAVGALPLGIIVTSSGKPDQTTGREGGLEHLKNLSGMTLSPKIILTDYCVAERNSLNKHFPQAQLFVYKFRVLQCIWRYLADPKHNITRNDRNLLYEQFREIINCESEESFNKNFDAAFDSPVTKKYKHYVDYLLKYRRRAYEWAIYFRKHLISDNHSNKYSESSMRIMRDKVFYRSKAFNTLQLFQFLTTVLNEYFERKLIDAVNNRVEGITKLKTFVGGSQIIENLHCTKIGEFEFEVNSHGRINYVDVFEGQCTCYVGRDGAPCKHQLAAVTKYNLSPENLLPLRDGLMKTELHYLATGTTLDDPTWCDHPIAMEVTLDEANIESESDISDNSECYSGDTYVEDGIDVAEPVSELCDDLNGVFGILKAKLTSDTARYHDPIRRFVDSFHDIDTNSELVSALETFGKFCESGVKRKNTLQEGNSSKRFATSMNK